MMSQFNIKPSFTGWFRKCLKIPVLQSAEAEKYAIDLIEKLDSEKCLDMDTAPETRDADLSTDYLFSKARGQMFGILVCLNPEGEKIILKAFSGQYNSRWLIPGWVPPVIDPDAFDTAVREKDKEIKKLDRQIEELAAEEEESINRKSDAGSSIKKTEASDYEAAEIQDSQNKLQERILYLKDKRKKISQDLMKEIHSLYYLHNFEGEIKSMAEVFLKNIDDKRGKTHKTDAVTRKHTKNAPENPVMTGRSCRVLSGSEEACPAQIKAMQAGDAEEVIRTGIPETEYRKIPTMLSGMPAGTGDCCAPKLLNYAAGEGLIPLSLIEFYYGRGNKSGTKKHRHFYPPCTEKCAPILTYMLRGAEKLQEKYKHLIK